MESPSALRVTRDQCLATHAYTYNSHPLGLAKREMPPASNRHNQELQALRGLAVFGVLAYHLTTITPGIARAIGPWATVFAGGGKGVDLFFAISGYVITLSMIRMAGSLDAVDVRTGLRFWLRRAIRTLPPAFVWLAFALIMALLFPLGGTVEDNLGHAGAAALQVANFHLYYCAQTQSCGIFGYYWSLSAEEQFYFIMPLLLVRLRLPAFVCMMAAIASFAIVIRVIPLDARFGVLSVLRYDGMALGVLLGMLQGSRPRLRLGPGSGSWRRAAIGVALASQFFLWGYGGAFKDHRIVQMLPLSFATVLIVAIASLESDAAFPRGPLRRLFVYLGDLSYSIYLINVPVILLTGYTLWNAGILRVDGAWPIATALLSFAITIALAHGSYVLLERPIQRRAVRWTSSPPSIAEEARLRA